MKKVGKLEKLTDLKEFWELMLGPPQTVQHIATPPVCRPHPLIEEEEEEEEDGEHVSWALTTLPPEPEAKERWKSNCFHSEPLQLPQVCPIDDILNSASSSESISHKVCLLKEFSLFHKATISVHICTVYKWLLRTNRSQFYMGIYHLQYMYKRLT